jgi:hypothetical protein
MPTPYINPAVTVAPACAIKMPRQHVFVRTPTQGSGARCHVVVKVVCPCYPPVRPRPNQEHPRHLATCLPLRALARASPGTCVKRSTRPWPLLLPVLLLPCAPRCKCAHGTPRAWCTCPSRMPTSSKHTTCSPTGVALHSTLGCQGPSGACAGPPANPRCATTGGSTYCLAATHALRCCIGRVSWQC